MARVHFPRLSAAASRFDWLAQAASTNDELTGRATGAGADGWGHLSIVATAAQTSGRGRLGRSWVAPPGSALALSVLVRPSIPVTAFGWLPLMAGAAMTAAVRSAGAQASLKWPNDVLVGDRKLSGILCELLPDLRGAVIGVGVNVSMTDEQLPVPTATSLALEGASTDMDALAADFVADLGSRIARFEAAAGDAISSGIRADIVEACGTIGRAVRVVMPDGGEIVGEATDIDADGRLRVARDGVSTLSVAAGDVTHLRY